MSAPRTPLATVGELLATVAELPPVARHAARERIDAALHGDARACRAALGMLALELAPAVEAGRLHEVIAVVDLDSGATTFELAEDAPLAAQRQLPQSSSLSPWTSTPARPVALTA